MNATTPELSVIVSTPDTFHTVRRTVSFISKQTALDKLELVIVCPSAQALQPDAALLARFPRVRIVELEAGKCRIAQFNAAGVQAASAPVVVFTEDHAFPDPHWAQALIDRHREPHAVVGPAVTNANPSTLVSCADSLIGYAPWLEPVAGGTVGMLPGHNSSYKRDLLLAYGPGLDDMLEAEAVLQWELLAKGHTLYLEPAAKLNHTNFAYWGIWTKVQFQAGRVFAATRALRWSPGRRLLYAAASPLIPLVRLVRILRQGPRLNGAHPLFPRVLPALVYGLVLDGVGQFVGYLVGVGGARDKLADYEFHRFDYITPDDRTRLEAAA